MGYFTSIERKLKRAIADAESDPGKIVLITPVIGDEFFHLDSATCESEDSLTLRYGSEGKKKRKKGEQDGYELTLTKNYDQVTVTKGQIKFLSEDEPGILFFGDTDWVMKKIEMLNRRSASL